MAKLKDAVRRVLYPAYEHRVVKFLPGRPHPAARRPHARRQPPLGQGRRPRHGGWLPGRRRQHLPAARLVRGGGRQGRDAVAALQRQPHQPSARADGRTAADHRGRGRVARRHGPLAHPPGGGPRPAPGQHRAEAQGRRRTPPATSTGSWSTSPSGTAGGARSRTPYGRCSRSTPRAAPRWRSWPTSSTSSTSPTTSTPRASPTPTSSSARRGSSASAASCCGSRRTRSSTSARRCGPTSAASTSCGPSARTPSASAASAVLSRARPGAVTQRSSRVRACRCRNGSWPGVLSASSAGGEAC